MKERNGMQPLQDGGDSVPVDQEAREEQAITMDGQQTLSTLGHVGGLT